MRSAEARSSLLERAVLPCLVVSQLVCELATETLVAGLRDYSWVTAGALTAWLSVPCVVGSGFALARDAPRVAWPRPGPVAFVGLCTSTSAYLGMAALASVPYGYRIVSKCTKPLFVAAAKRVCGHELPQRWLEACVLVFVGMALVSSRHTAPGPAASPQAHWLGTVALIVACCMDGAVAVVEDKYLRGSGSPVATMCGVHVSRCFFIAPLVAPLGLGDAFWAIASSQPGALVLVSALAPLSQLALFAALSVHGSFRTVVTTSTRKVVSLWLSLWRSGNIGAGQVVGGVCIVGGAFVVSLRPPPVRPRPPAWRPVPLAEIV